MGAIQILASVPSVVGIVLLLRHIVFPRRWGGTDPSCPGCGYSLRGLQSAICPECGGDLRKSGVLMPASIRPMGRPMRLLIFSLMSFLPIVLIEQFARQRIAPWDAEIGQRRTIVSQVKDAQLNVQVDQTHHAITFGRQTLRPDLPMQAMTLRLIAANGTLLPARYGDALRVDLRTGASTFRDGIGVEVKDAGPFKVKTVVDWLTAQGLSGDGAALVAGDVHYAADEMRHRRVGRINFTSVGDGNASSTVAEPVIAPGLTQHSATAATYATSLGSGMAVSLLGLPLALRRWRARTVPLAASAIAAAASANSAEATPPLRR